MRSSKTNIPDSKKTSTGRRPEGVYNLNSSDVIDKMTLMAGFLKMKMATLMAGF